MDDVKHQIAEFIFMNYLQRREEKSTHRVDWPNMDWKNLKHVWTSSSYHSVMHIRQLRLLMEHEPCGEILNERKYDPTRWEEWKRDDPLDSFREPSADSTIIKPVYHDDEVEFISSLSSSFIEEGKDEEDEKKDEEEENEEKDENEEEDEKEDVDIISEPFHCKHCGVFESIEHWAIDCSNNPIDISNSLIFVVEKSNENNSNKKEAVSFCKKLLPKINSLKDKRKAVRCLRGNFHQLSLPKIGPKPKIIILKALKQLILARWFARCNLKHSKNNPFKNLLRIKDYSSSTNIT